MLSLTRFLVNLLCPRPPRLSSYDYFMIWVGKPFPENKSPGRLSPVNGVPVY
jgi:hypothetical protein